MSIFENRDVFFASVSRRFGREYAAAAGVAPGKFSKARVFVSRARFSRNAVRARLWSGLNPMGLSYFKNKMDETGVISKEAGGDTWRIPHAFMVKRPGGQVFLNPKWRDILPPTIEFDPRRALPAAPRAPGRPRVRAQSPATPKRPAATRTLSEAAREGRESRKKAADAKAKKHGRFRAGRLVHVWSEGAQAQSLALEAQAYAEERLMVEFEHELKFEVSRRR